MKTLCSKKDSDFSPPTELNPNPKPNTKKNVLHIGGIQVEFPYQPYGTQLAFMNRVISTLDRAQRDGRSHALLESPTGTGKSLSLLCSSLAWQQNLKSKNVQSNISNANSKPNSQAVTDPIKFGGGFVPETQPSPEMGSSVRINGQTKKKKLAPTIFYASRTHSQIRQVIHEYRKTTHRVPMAVLASRKHYCTNKIVQGGDNIDEQCKLLLKDQEVGCSEFKNVHKIKGHPSLQKGGCHEAHDIEDLVKVGEVVKGCPYFAARSMAEDAELVFCPYSYIISPVIRRAMEVDIQGAIIIFDEAHNIEDVARDAGSIDVEEDVLIQLQRELEQLRLTDPITYQPLLEMIQEILSWMDRRKTTLEKCGFQHYFSCWTGDKAFIELEEVNISPKCFPILHDCATKAIKAASDAEVGLACLSGMAATVLEGLFSAFNYFFSGNGLHANDYLLVVQRYIKREGVLTAGGWIHSLSLWCLNPAVVFRDIADVSLSVILTSGTLSPMNSFSSELGVHFGTCLEAPHVVDVEAQLWTALISRGPDEYPLNASYRTAEAYAFQDSLGTSLEEIFKIVPGGCLVFFPSYKLMDRLCNRWQETGQWSRLNAKKPLFIEPRGGSQDVLEAVLKGYYNSIHQRSKPLTGRKKRGKKSDVDDNKAAKFSQNTKRGAAFLAVCRGKISEGIDFSDDNARVVIIVGIPFPNIHDTQVAQKKKFNDTYKSTKNLVSGNEWYCNQAFRALNQATGRCIRHRFDYGAIILLDERFCEDRNRAHISKWFRKSIRQFDNFENSLVELKSFFRAVKDRVDKAAESSQNIDIKVEDISSGNKNKGIPTKNSLKEYRPNQSGQKLSSGCLVTEKAALCQSFNSDVKSFFSQDMSNVKGLISLNEKKISSCREYIDLEYDTEKDSSCGTNLSVMSSVDPAITIVKETPSVNDCVPAVISGMLLKNEYSSLTMDPSCTEHSDYLSYSPMGVTNSSLAPKSKSLVVTPEKLVNNEGFGVLPERESPYNLSANSYSQKRRKSLSLSSGSPQAGLCGTPVARNPGDLSFMTSSIMMTDATYKDTSASEVIDSGREFGNQIVAQSSLSVNDSDTSCVSFGSAMDKRLQIFCSVCKNPLGHPLNNLIVPCSLTSCSKVYFRSIWMEKLENVDTSTSSIPVLISHISSVDQRLCERNNEVVPGGPGQGVWCKEDGCVFNTIFCPFCSGSDTCLGIQVMATDALNAWLQNKILFCSDILEIKDLTASKDQDLSSSSTSRTSNLSSSSTSCTSKRVVLSFIEKFTYLPQTLQMQLPKRGLLSTSKG